MNIKINQKEKSITKELLLALVPYTRQNMLLTFKPSRFFDELEKSSSIPKHRLRSAYNRARRDKIVIIDNNRVRLSLNGRQIVQPFVAKKLSHNAQLMTIFDVPEVFADRRRKFRYLLRQLGFKQIQQSVWMSNKDHRAILFESIDEMKLHKWVQLYEASRITTFK